MDDSHDDGLFDARIAETYDADVAHRFDPDALDAEVGCVASLAGSGPVLEFAIGTGRLALPLRERGLDVDGIEVSRAMLEQLRAKPGGAEVAVTIGDMATADAPGGPYSLVALVFSTITNLLTQGEQVACFANAARHLAPGGRFVVETGVRDLRRLAPGERFVPFEVSDTHIGIDEYDTVRQRSTSHHMWFRPDGTTHRFASQHRYVWPSELDLMAQLAGLELEHRWGGWREEPINDTSTSHVAVWRRAE